MLLKTGRADGSHLKTKENKMITTTKKMREDIRKLNEDDLVVCDTCGSEKLSEKMWVDSNSYISIDGDSYFKYVNGTDDTQYWCDSCNDMARPIHITEYKEKKWKKLNL